MYDFKFYQTSMRQTKLVFFCQFCDIAHICLQAKYENKIFKYSWTNFSFIGELWPNLDLEIWHTKDFSWKNGPNLPDFEREKIQIAKVLW
jgi:hypothetical protein